LHAIGAYAKELYGSVRVRYVSSEEFTNDFINSIRDDKSSNFQRRYRDLDVLLVDDILESGRTLAFAIDLLAARGARVTTCCLLEKPGKRAVQIAPTYVGFTCPDQFVVGYGMDVAHCFRELPFIGVVEMGG
ncbi:MAG: hypoxanthine phosphoribosyltransferase, partial [Oxalobacteraceae bacterium]|nr:hypoxanthine phosphoribosyltransferase [Oxalobacteraceae bacterium]